METVINIFVVVVIEVQMRNVSILHVFGPLATLEILALLYANNII